jgi:hypothetical protein
MTKTENTNTGMRAVLGGVFGASCIAPRSRKSLGFTPGYLPARLLARSTVLTSGAAWRHQLLRRTSVSLLASGPLTNRVDPSQHRLCARDAHRYRRISHP